jgi:20S proteasome alpha/beta subunit
VVASLKQETAAVGLKQRDSAVVASLKQETAAVAPGRNCRGVSETGDGRGGFFGQWNSPWWRL